jgi:hypothetical protein
MTAGVIVVELLNTADLSKRLRASLIQQLRRLQGLSLRILIFPTAPSTPGPRAIAES